VLIPRDSELVLWAQRLAQEVDVQVEVMEASGQSTRIVFSSKRGESLDE
jgi:hypothetical protein